MRLKIITLYSGEKEYGESKKSVKRQKVRHSVDVSFIENKTKPEAHGLLYEMIMSERHSYDYFIKLDADMIFTDDGAVEKIIQYAVESGSDIFSIPVHDFLTDSMIWGLNVYRSGVRWFVDSESLFTDQQRLNGCFSSSKRYLKKDESLVSHASMADDFQGFVFGIHRAAKIVQTFLLCTRRNVTGSKLNLPSRSLQLTKPSRPLQSRRTKKPDGMVRVMVPSIGSAGRPLA